MQDTDTAAQTTPTQAERECPVCHAPIPVYLGYVIWCDRCNWNVQPTPPEKPSSFFATFYERLGRKMSNDLFDEVMEQPRLKPTLTLSITLAYAIATVVHLITLLIAGIGIV